MNIVRKIIAYAKLRKAIQLADERHALDGDRHYVMPYINGKLIVMDRRSFRRMKLKGYIPKKCKVDDLIRESFYFTPYVGDKESIQPAYAEAKRQEYYHYIEMNKK